jgi:hypothetical protein
MASSRKQAVAQLVAILGAIAPAGGYTNDLTGPGACSIAQETQQRRRESGLPAIVRIRDADEFIERASVTGDRMQARLVLVIELYRKRVGDEVVVNQMNDLIEDVRLAIDKNTTLNGAVVDCFVSAVEAPVYDFDEQDSTCSLQATADYYFTQGAGV